jgi:carboxypeptidase C (cathepsin A)
MRKVRQVRSGGDKLGGYFPHYKPCTDNYMNAYLNKKEVQAAIHVKSPGSVDWSVCSDAINEAYDPADVAAPMMHVYKELIAGGKLRILIYSGDDDSICSTAGAQMWVWGMGKAVEAWKPWFSHGQVAGYTVEFPGFRFSTVHGAGHMVPSTRPQQAFDLFAKFLEDKPW